MIRWYLTHSSLGSRGVRWRQATGTEDRRSTGGRGGQQERHCRGDDRPELSARGCRRPARDLPKDRGHRAADCSGAAGWREGCGQGDHQPGTDRQGRQNSTPVDCEASRRWLKRFYAGRRRPPVMPLSLRDAKRSPGLTGGRNLPLVGSVAVILAMPDEGAVRPSPRDPTTPQHAWRRQPSASPPPMCAGSA